MEQSALCKLKDRLDSDRIVNLDKLVGNELMRCGGCAGKIPMVDLYEVLNSLSDLYPSVIDGNRIQTVEDAVENQP